MADDRVPVPEPVKENVADERKSVPEPVESNLSDEKELIPERLKGNAADEKKSIPKPVEATLSDERELISKPVEGNMAERELISEPAEGNVAERESIPEPVEGDMADDRQLLPEPVEGYFIRIRRCASNCCTFCILFWVIVAFVVIVGICIAIFATIWFPLFLIVMAFLVALTLFVSVSRYIYQLLFSTCSARREEMQVDTEANVASHKPISPTDHLPSETDTVPSTSSARQFPRSSTGEREETGKTDEPLSTKTLDKSRTRCQTEEISCPASAPCLPLSRSATRQDVGYGTERPIDGQISYIVPRFSTDRGRRRRLSLSIAESEGKSEVEETQLVN